MKNETVTLSLELTDKIESHLDLRANFDPSYPGETMPWNNEAVLLLELRAALAEPVPPAICATCNGTGIEYDGAGHTCTACNGEPVPPAGGEPEVFEPHGWAQTDGPAINAFTQEFDIAEEWAMAGYGTVELLNREHVDAEIDRLRGEHQAIVTRLQAEVRLLKHDVASYLETAAKTCGLLGIDLEAAKTAEGKPSDVLYRHALALQSDLTSANADKEAYAQNAIDLRKRVDTLQAELTKARELLTKLSTKANIGYANKVEVDAFLAHQSAPAAKDGV